ncbi:MAG: hypothetical protein II649_01345 [Kiritimatiellae bacterium]|nr:hypothetical protein [Kiritimatiellia bacterium]
MTRFVSIDFETTGTVSGWPNEPWQLGCVEVVDGKPDPATRREAFFRIAADRPFSPRAPGRWAQLRGELAAASPFEEKWPELSLFLVGVPLVAHNASTERTMLVKRAPLAPFGPWFDTLRIVRRFWPALKSYALGDVVRSFGLQARLDGLCPGRTWHDALYDACAGAVLFAHILSVAGWDVVRGEAV